MSGCDPLDDRFSPPATALFLRRGRITRHRSCRRAVGAFDRFSSLSKEVSDRTWQANFELLGHSGFHPTPLLFATQRDTRRLQRVLRALGFNGVVSRNANSGPPKSQNSFRMRRHPGVDRRRWRPPGSLRRDGLHVQVDSRQHHPCSLNFYNRIPDQRRHSRI